MWICRYRVTQIFVEIRRRRNPSQSYNNEFADWQLVAPTISTKIMSHEFNNGQRWGKKRCSDPLESTIPPSAYAQAYFHAEGSPIPPSQYSDGVLLDVPGRASGQLLNKTVTASWPAAAKKVTAGGWYFTCLSNIDGTGTEGFYGYAPNGERYRFDIKRSRNAVAKNDIWYITYTTLGANVSYANEAPYYDVLAASEVTDVHGNWVRYVYDAQGKLTRIHSNDGRQIDLAYNVSNRVASVTAHSGSPEQRQWTYVYGGQTINQYIPPAQANGVPTTGSRSYTVLSAVNLPNGRSWQFALGGLFAEAVPGDTYRALPNNNPQVFCKQVDQVVSITHPDGIVGQFELKEFTRLHPIAATSQYGPPCPKSSIGRGLNSNADFMAVTKKTLSANSVPTAIWQYSYLNAGDAYNGQTGSNRSVVTQPDGSVRVNHFNPISSGSNPSITKEDIYANASATTPMQTTTFSYVADGAAGTSFVQLNTGDVTKALLRKLVTLTRGGDWYKSDHSYVTDRTLANYSYGAPTQIDQWSSLGGGTRTTNYAYLKDEDDWILGLVDTVTKNGTLFDDYDYDAKGRLTTHKRFGVTVATLGYHTTGVQAGKLNWYKDALNRQTTYANYHRGAPRTITQADSTSVTRELDSNGWVTRHTNARGYATFYQYDPVGRLTLIDRPSPWSDTSIDYLYSGATLLQTAMRGTERTTTTFDAMLQPVQVERKDLNTGGSSIYTRTTYDALGRVIFASLPAATAGSPIGTETSYDVFGRVTQVRETATGGGTTAYAYLSGNRTQVTDPMGNVTTTTANGYGDPGDGKTIKVQKPQGITVDFSYDIHGKLLSIAQAKGDGTTHNSSFVYDARHRLCRRKIPETGDTLYLYNNADEMTAYAEGQAGGTTCATPPAGSSVTLSYDLMGRLTTTDYPGTTPDIVRSYDPNGNLLTINRGGVNWSYAYNSLDLIEDETLALDGRSYVIDQGYDNDGVLISRTYPSGQQFVYTNDGFGRPTRVQSGSTTYLQNISYHPNGRIHLLTRGNGGLYEQLLNARQLPSHIGGNWGDNLNYSYNAKGRVTQIDAVTYNAYDRSFGYDGAGRLISATGPWGGASFSYDPLGNLKQQQLGSRIVDVEYNSLNQVLRARDSAAGNVWRNYTHDARGNVTADGLRTFGYDFANQPVSLTGTGGGSYSYDGNLKRVKQVVGGETIYSIYDKSGALLTRDNATTNVKTDYVTVAGQTFVRVRNGVASYPLNDHLGTALMETDANGSVAATKSYNYTPFGESIAPPIGNAGNDPGNTNEQGYTGHIEDASGLTYMQARYYDPVIGRFLSPDPVGYLDQLNLYAYVYNDPINTTDPNGMCPWCIGAVIGVVVEAGVQMARSGGHVTDWKAVGVAAAVGAVTGGVGSMLATQAVKGTVTAAYAIRTTAAVGGVSNGVGTVTSNALNGEATSPLEAAAAVVGGAVGAGIGAKSANAMASSLDDLAKSSNGILREVSAATRDSYVGKVAAGRISTGEALGATVTETALNVAQKEIKKVLMENGDQK